MKRLVAALAVVLSLATMSCTKSDEGIKSNQSEIESKRRPGGGGSGGGGGEVISNIPAVTGLTATATGPTEVRLTWNSITNATTYWIYRDNYVLAIIPETSHIDVVASPGTTYTYAVAAVVSSNLGPRSASVTVTTPR
jgi:hypothetical protein